MENIKTIILMDNYMLFVIILMEKKMIIFIYEYIHILQSYIKYINNIINGGCSNLL